MSSKMKRNNNTFTIAILLLLCFLSHAVSEEKDTVTINLDEKIVDEEENTPLKMTASESHMELIAQNGDIVLESSENVKLQARTGDIRMRTSNEVSVSAVSDVTIETNTGDIRFSTRGVGKAVRTDADMYVSRDLRVANRLTGSVLSDGRGGEIQNGT